MADLQTTICGIEFPNPILTAAGPTSADAEMLERAARGGAGGLVAKTISVKPAVVPIPNIASPFSGSLLNAELWSEIPYQKFIDTELRAARKLGLPLIASVGYTPEDLARLGRALQKAKVVDAVEFSIHYVGKDAETLRELALALKENIDVPVLAKLSPSVFDLAAVITTLNPIVDGFVAINSLGPALDFDIETRRPYLGSEDGRGWLSGHAILPVGLHFVEAISSLSDKPVIGVGGIRSVKDAVKYIMAGAAAVQICSLPILKGQDIYGKLAAQLSKWMDDHGYQDIDSLRGAYKRQPKRPQYFLNQGPQLYPKIIYEKCTYCNLCVKSCVHNAIVFADKRFILDPQICVSCGLCSSVCPTHALPMEDEAKLQT